MDRIDQRFYIITGGTVAHIAPHFSLCSPAYGSIGLRLRMSLEKRLGQRDDPEVILLRTRMAAGGQVSDREKRVYGAAGINHLETNEDLSKLVHYLIGEESTRCIVMAAAVCDWDPMTLLTNGNAQYAFGKDQPRLKTSEGDISLSMIPSAKIINRIRRERKDIFLVGFKATAGLTHGETYAAGLKLLKQTSANLVFANDVQNHQNMVVTPEEFPYHCKDRNKAIRTLAEMIVARTKLDFVRTSVVDDARAELRALDLDGAIPQNFAQVLAHLVERGAYKPFLGKTAGHFGCRVLKADYAYHRISSVRKVDHNLVFEEGMARIFGYEDGKIQAGGGKPSVGEHTQHQIHQRLGEAVHSIVHFHCPQKGDYVQLAAQKEFECGSVQCGENTASNMREVEAGIWAVHLEGHGPNIAFHKNIPAATVIGFIERNWDLDEKSGGLIR